MPQLLLDKNTVPSDFFRYTHAETGHTTIERDYWTWVEQAKKHRRANGLPISADFEAKMQDQLCAQLSPEQCAGSDPNRPWVDIRFALSDVVDAMRVFVQWAVDGFVFVSQGEATRRARICVGCYNNVSVPGCGVCYQLAKLITGSLAQRKTPHDEALKVCGACRCLNRAQVHVPLDALDGKDSPEKQSLYPSFCWLKKSGENYLPVVT